MGPPGGLRRGDHPGRDPGHLLAFLDGEGMASGFGVVESFRRGIFEVLAPSIDLSGVAAARIGSLIVDPRTGEEG